MARRILDEALACAQERKWFGCRTGNFQLVQAMLPNFFAERYARWSIVQDCVRHYDAKPARQRENREETRGAMYPSNLLTVGLVCQEQVPR